jgi:hypothetical protein
MPIASTRKFPPVSGASHAVRALAVGVRALAVGVAILGIGSPAGAADVPTATPDVVPAVVPAVSLVEVDLSDPAAARRLAELGLDVVDMRPGRLARVFLWPGDESVLAGSGLAWRLLDADYGRTVGEIAARDAAANPTLTRGSLAPSAVPAPGSGSFGGWYSLAEVEAFLDSLVTTYPGLCDTVRIGTSRQNRSIRALRITDEGQPDHSRPRVLYTSLTHAREPGGLQSLIEFMTRLIEGYGSDPDLTCLVNTREMWFVPVVNPDGYEYNRTTWINTGSFGFWRKNLRDNDANGTITGADGVDINRNFGFRWGHDNIGSSPFASSQTYRGPSAFSEPETRALRDFSIAHGFTTADNYHTFGELCLYPWGYIIPACPDSTFLIRMSEEMLAETGYTYGTGGDVLYTVNGDANDWMYGEQAAKPKAYSVTIEAGDENDGFWPVASRIVPLARQQFRANVIMAYAAGTWVHADTAGIATADGFWHPGNWADIAVRLRNDGVLPTTGGVTVSASTGTPGITVQDGACSWPAIAPGTAALPVGGDFIRLLASPSVIPGTRVPIVLHITDAGTFVHRDTVEVTVGTPVVVMSANGTSLSGWSPTGTWGLQTIDGNSVFSDSPSGKYPNGATTTLTRIADLDLSGGTNPVLTFRTLYDFERGYDAGRVEVSTNGGSTWTILKGRLNRPGKGNTGAYGGGTQESGQFVYDGTQRLWGDEVIDLAAYQGLTNVRLRFRLTSDSALNRDGWKIDDVVVRIHPIDVAGLADDPRREGGGTGDGGRGVADGSPEARPRLLAVAPNPVGRSGARVRADFPATTAYRLAVYDVQGRLIDIVSEGITPPGEREFWWQPGGGYGGGAGGSGSGGGGGGGGAGGSGGGPGGTGAGASPGRRRGPGAVSSVFYLALEWDGGRVTRAVLRVE